MVQKVCQDCGEAFEAREAYHKYCPKCFRAGRARQPTSRLGADYLEGGYFLDAEKTKLRPEIIDSSAIDAAKVLGSAQPPMTAHQLRRFYRKARAIESKLDRTQDFQLVLADIYTMKRDAADAVARKVVSEEFQRFMERNVELAASDESSFRKGFIQHFQSVLAYFGYYFKE